MKPSSEIKPKALIFDCWNTLFYIHSRQYTWSAIAQRFLHHQLSYPLMKSIEHELMTERQDDLRPALTRILRKNHIPPVAPVVEGIVRALDSATKRPDVYPESLEVLKSLRKDYKLGLLSNTHYQIFHQLDQTFELGKYFDVILPSYETGRIKPDPEIFQIVLDRLGVTPEEAVMVGDNLRDDVRAAEDVGMRGILVDRNSAKHRHPEQIRSLDRLQELL